MAQSVISQLPLLTWRGLDAPPYDIVGFEIQHEQAARGFPFVDVDVHTWVRRKSSPFKARLYFCETVEAGAFTDKWPAWYEALQDGSPDELNHPIFGPVQACVMQAGGEVKATVMDGIIVDVTWSETLLDPAQPTTLLAQNVDLGAACSEADALCSAAGINYPTGQPTTSLRGLFESIRGQIFSFGLTVTGAINQLIANVNAMADELGIQNDHTQYQALDGLITVYTGAVEYQAKIQSSARTTASTVTTSDITLDAFAASVGNSLQDVMGLNLQALRFPSVPPGQTLVYYTSK